MRIKEDVDRTTKCMRTYIIPHVVLRHWPMTTDEPSYNVELIISNKSRATISKDCLYPTSILGVEILSFYRFINVENIREGASFNIYLRLPVCQKA